MAGFQFTESLHGTFRYEGEERSIGFQVTARANSVWQFLHDRRAELEGTIDAQGLAEQAPLRGTLVIDPLVGRVIRYDVAFDGLNDRSYHLIGQKDINPTHPVESLTTLPVEISEIGGNLRMRGLMHFQAKDLPAFLASFRAVL